MSKTLPTIKRVIIFLILVIIVPWLNMAAFFSSASYFGGTEIQELYLQNSDQIYRNVSHLSFLAFILTYIIAKQIINKETDKKLWRLFFYILTDILCFFAVFFVLYATSWFIDF